MRMSSRRIVITIVSIGLGVVVTIWSASFYGKLVDLERSLNRPVGIDTSEFALIWLLLGLVIGSSATWCVWRLPFQMYILFRCATVDLVIPLSIFLLGCAFLRIEFVWIGVGALCVMLPLSSARAEWGREDKGDIL